jgi:hypothetical protein
MTPLLRISFLNNTDSIINGDKIVFKRRVIFCRMRSNPTGDVKLVVVDDAKLSTEIDDK